MAMLVLYRVQKRNFASEAYPYVLVDGERRGQLKVGGYSRIPIAPGPHSIKVDGSVTTNWFDINVACNANALPNQTLYYRVVVHDKRPNVGEWFAGALSIEEVSQVDASPELRTLLDSGSP